MVGFGLGPAADAVLARLAEAVVQFGVVDEHDEGLDEPAVADRDRQPGVTPEHLLLDHRLQPRRLERRHACIGRVHLIEAEGDVLLHRFPQGRVGGDHIGRVVEPVEHLADGSQHLFCVVVDRREHLALLLRQLQLYIVVEHRLPPEFAV